MSKPNEELCGSCCRGSQPIRKSFKECGVCACGAPFFSEIVVEKNLPNSRRCLIEIPADFMEDHGHRFGKSVIFEEEDSGSGVYSVEIGGNIHLGFGFEWKEFAQSHNIGVGQTVVFTLVRYSQFLVQIYKPGNSLPTAPKVEHDDDEIEVCVAQDWLAAKASRSSATDPALCLKVKVEQVFSQSSTEQATQVPEKDAEINAKEKQRCGILKVGADSEIIDKGRSVQPTIGKESPAPITSATAERKERQEEEQTSNSSENEEMGNSDSSWSPRNSNSRRRSSKGGAHSGTSSDTKDDDELLVNNAARRRKQPFSQGRSFIDTKGKRVRPDTERPYANDEDGTSGTKSDLLVEGLRGRKNGRGWHEAGTKRGRTYVSRRRPATESEKEKVLEKARGHNILNPGFLKQLHKDSCYRALQLFPPEKFYRENMIPSSEGSYKATLENEYGDKWTTNILGRRIFWKHFTLDHNLEEDDVVIFELTYSRKESVTFRVRVVDIKKLLTGKAGWAVHYNVVEGTKKQYFQERRRLQEAEGLKKQKKQKQRLKDRSSSISESATVSEFYRSRKDPKVMDRSSGSHGRGKPLKKEGASGNEVDPHTIGKRPTTRLRNREINRSSDEL